MTWNPTTREQRVNAFLDGIESVLTATDGDPGASLEEFAAKRLWIKTKSAQVIPFALNGVQRAYAAKKAKALAAGARPRFLCLKYRQGGITTYEQACSYRLVATSRNQRCVTFAQTREKTAEIFDMVHLFHERDPEAPAKRNTGKSPLLDFAGLNSKFIVSTAGASGGGRGGTYQRVHWSEVAHSCKGPDQIQKQREVLTAFSIAAEFGEMVLETTPRGSELFRELWRGAKEGTNDWTPIFLAWFEDDTNRDALEAGEDGAIMASLDARESELVAMHGLDASQIKWRRRKVRELGPLFRQEYPEDDASCFLQSGTCYFNTDLVIARMEQIPDYTSRTVDGAIFRHIPGGYEVEFEPPIPHEKYCGGVDTSEGLSSSDPCGIGLLNKNTGRTAYALHGLFTPRQLAEHTARVSKRYNHALMGVERENHGHAVLQKLEDISYAHPRVVYHHKPGQAGWSTNSITRPVMIDGLADWLYHDPTNCLDRQMLAECLTFNKQRDGSFSADSGSHDDAVMKWAIAVQMRKVRTELPRITTVG